MGLNAHAARRAGLPVHTLCALGRLQPPPITTRFYRIVREFWIDRLVIAVLMTLGTIILAISPIPLWIKLMVPLSSFPLLYFVYEWLAKGDTIFAVEHEVPAFARRIAELVDVRVVTFGHTHRPRVIPLEKHTSFIDTGTWAPILSNGGSLARLQKLPDGVLRPRCPHGASRHLGRRSGAGSSPGRGPIPRGLSLPLCPHAPGPDRGRCHGAGFPPLGDKRNAKVGTLLVSIVYFITCFSSHSRG